MKCVISILTFAICLCMEVCAEPIDSALATDGCELAEEPWEPTASDYIQDGLGMMFDAYENVGWGIQDHTDWWFVNLANGLVWSNLKNYYNSRWVWRDGYFHLGQSQLSSLVPAIKDIVNSGEWTVEVVFKCSEFGTGAQGVKAYSTAVYGITIERKQIILRANDQIMAIIPSFLLNEIYNFAVTYDGEVSKVYMNGILVAEKPTSATTTGYSGYVYGPLDMGCHRAYTRALSDDEIYHNYIVDRLRFN